MDISFEETKGDLLHFISKSPFVFHAVRYIKAALLYAGFTEIREEDSWQIKRGGKYVVTRNGSALIAFSVPKTETILLKSLPHTVIRLLSRLKKILRCGTANTPVSM